MDDAGWRLDKEMPGVERWWDGVDWTGFTRPTQQHPPAPSPWQSRAEEARVVHVQERTGAVLAIALWPTWAGMATFMMTSFGLASALAGGLLSLLPVLLAVALFWMAGRDRETLRSRGAKDAASPLWMFLTPLGYLVARWVALKPYARAGEAGSSCSAHSCSSCCSS